MQVLSVEQRAARARALLADDMLRHVIDTVRQRQVDVFLKGGSPEEVVKAQSVIAALVLLTNELQGHVTAELVAKKQKR